MSKNIQEKDIEPLLAQLEEHTEPKEKIYLLHTLVHTLQPHDPQSALNYGEQAIDIARQNGKHAAPKLHLATSLHYVSRLHLQLANYPSALRHALEAHDLFETLENLDAQADVLRIMAESCQQLYAHHQSLHYYQQLYQIHTQRNDQHGQARSLTNIGMLYLDLQDYGNAISNLEEAVTIAQEASDVACQALALSSSSAAYLARDEYENAQQCASASVTLYTSAMPESDELGQALIRLGQAYQAQRDYPSALTHFQHACQIYHNLHDQAAEANAHVRIAAIHNANQAPDAAIATLAQALMLGEQAQNTRVLHKCHRDLAHIYKQLGELHHALAHLEHHLQLREQAWENDGQCMTSHRNRVHQIHIDHVKNTQLAHVIEGRQKAESALETSNAQTDALFHLVRTLAAHESLPTMLQGVAATVSQKLPASQVILHTFDHESHQVTHFVEARTDIQHPYHPPFQDLMDTLVGWAVSKSQPILTTKDHVDPRESKSAQHTREEMGIRSVIVIPLYYAGTMFGALTALNLNEARDFSYDDLSLLRAMASQVAIAISNAQRTEQALHLKEFNENIVQGVGEAILIEDTQGILTFANPAAEILLGYTHQELLGQHWSKFIPPEELEHVYTLVAERAVEHHHHYETLVQHKDGHTIPVFVTATTLQEQGKPVGVLAAFTDISELKQAEATLRQRTAELELQNIELDAFAHTVAHDLRSPLTTIVGFSDLLTLRFEELTEDRRRYGLEAISESGHKMSEIINELLLLASVRQLETVERQALDMVEIVSAVRSRLSYQIEHRHAHIIAPEQWPVALGYGPWVEEIWANYISNAIKYGGSPPHIELGFNEIRLLPKSETEKNALTDYPASQKDNPKPEALEHDASASEDMPSTTPPPTHIRFWVHDNGQGLSKEEQERLFTPFERLNQAHAEGHGLGLSIVRRIVEKLGGTAGVESDLGKGSTFYFALPCAPQNPSPRQ